MIDAFQWLFDSSDYDLESLICVKKLKESSNTGRFNVCVELHVDQYETKRIITKNFLVEGTGKLNSPKISKSTVSALEETDLGERIPVTYEYS